MKAPDESGIKKDFPEKAARAGKRCTDGIRHSCGMMIFLNAMLSAALITYS